MRKFIVGSMGLMLATSVMAGNFSGYYSAWNAFDVDVDIEDAVGFYVMAGTRFMFA